jgi:hypothetical protein
MSLKRRDFIAMSASVTAMAAASGSKSQNAAGSGLVVCMHGITSDGFDFRTTMEGWARALQTITPYIDKVQG